MSISNALQQAMGQVNAALASTFLPEGAQIFLGKRGEHTQAFEAIGLALTGAFILFEDNRSESGLLRHATTGPYFKDDWAQATHVFYGVPDDDGNIEVFEFVEDEKDTLEPTGTSPFWSGRIRKVENERYTI